MVAVEMTQKAAVRHSKQRGSLNTREPRTNGLSNMMKRLSAGPEMMNSFKTKLGACTNEDGARSSSFNWASAVGTSEAYLQ